MRTIIISLLLLYCAINHTAFAQNVKLTQESTVTDSSGKIISYDLWSTALINGEGGIGYQKTSGGIDGFIFHMYSPKEKALYDSLLEKLPAPEESTSFRTGQRFSNIHTTDMYGQKINTKSMRGKIIVINYWFIGCQPCRREIPLLNKITEKYKNDSDVVFIAVALDEADAIADFLKIYPFNYRIIDRGSFLARDNLINSYPTNVVLDRKGRVYFHTSGFSEATPVWIRKSIEALKETPAPDKN